MACNRSKGRAYAKQQYLGFVAVKGLLGNVIFKL